ncbi:MAG: DUF4252 domain-containing protein [Bacteroidales bacterium]|nr:DUF4252 domain-containing protein [Bacteroidales bacterium]
MKRFFLCIIAFAMIAFSSAEASAQSRVDQLYANFSSCRNVESFELKGILMRFAAGFMDHSDPDEEIAAQFLKSVDKIQVLDLSCCTESDRERFLSTVDQLQLDGYELLMEASDSEENVKIFIKHKKDTIVDFLLLASGDEATMVRINGKVPVSLLQYMTSEAQSKVAQN